MNEAGFWQRWVKPALHAPGQRMIARKLSTMLSGLPDVLGCADGQAYLMELKYLDGPPKRATTPVRLGVTPEQYRHLAEWASAGGRALLLVGIGREWLLFRGDQRDAPLEDLRGQALAMGTLSREGMSYLARSIRQPIGSIRS